MLEIESVSKTYKDAVVLNNVTFSITAGSVCGFLGPNGAGKTTLIRILTGIIHSDSGHIKINGESLNKLSVKKIGYLPEERGLYKKMRVGEQAVYLAVLKGVSRQEAEKRIRHWFEKLGITDWWDKQVDTLSKGMQQKIQFIVSVIHQPDILILDEPFSGLDPVNREVLGKEIVELNQSGMTIILSTHDMNSVEQFCNQVVLIDKGNILLAGEVSDIKQVRKSFIYEFYFKQNEDWFMSQCNSFNAQTISSEKKDNEFCVKSQFRSEQDARDLLASVLEQTCLTSFREILPSMHDIFVESVTYKRDKSL